MVQNWLSFLNSMSSAFNGLQVSQCKKIVIGSFDGFLTFQLLCLRY
jgi:hypothetical protein